MKIAPGVSVRYRYRMIQTSWGVAVDLTGRLAAVDSPESSVLTLKHGFSVAGVPGWLTDEERDFLRKGFDIAGPTLLAGSSFGARSLLVIEELWFNPCDFQPEGLTCAAIGLVEALTGEKILEVPVSFDAATNRYEFRFPE